MKAESNLFFVSVLSLLALCVPVLGFSGSGSGTEQDPYIITNVDELQAMNNDLGAWYVLGNDIDASDTQNWNGGAGFDPVGSFTGTFDGQRHIITGLFIDRPSTARVGLFRTVSDGAEIKNVGLVDINITGSTYVGALTGENGYGSTIFNSWSSGNITGTYSVGNAAIGGLVGRNNYGSSILRCYSTADVVSGGAQIGGLSGSNDHGSVIIDSYATGSVNGMLKVGGLVGDNTYGSEEGFIIRCYSTGKVTGGGGGLVGCNWQGGVTYDSYWDTQTSGKTSSYGGTGKTTAQMMQQATFVTWDFVDVWDIVENETYPFLRPILKPTQVAVDIKPRSCPNPLNLASKGILPVAILGSEGFDVSQIDAASVRLAGVAPIRSSYEDVATPVSDGNECDCTTEGPDGYTDLTLKFRTQEIVEELVNAQGELADGEVLVLTLMGVLSDQTPIEGADCIVLVGNVPKALAAKRWDYNGDGIINILDFAELATYWLESTVY